MTVAPSSISNSASIIAALPIVNPPPVITPVVVRVSLPKSSAPPLSVMLPLANVRLPMLEPVAAAMVHANVTLAPENVAAVVEPDFISRLLLLLVREPY